MADPTPSSARGEVGSVVAQGVGTVAVLGVATGQSAVVERRIRGTKAELRRCAWLRDRRRPIWDPLGQRMRLLRSAAADLLRLFLDALDLPGSPLL
jgi:hypothetical protein